MNAFDDPDNPDKDKCLGDNYVKPGAKDTQVQLVISLALGLSAFFAFCVGLPSPPILRPVAVACLSRPCHAAG